MNRLGIIIAKENTRKSDCENSRFCFYVPSSKQRCSQQRWNETLSERAESGDSLGGEFTLHSAL